MSDYLKAEVCRNGKRYVQEYSRGVPLGEVKEVGTSSETGTTITFHPDKDIFIDIHYKYSILVKRMRELAFLNAGIRLTTPSRDCVSL